METLRIKVGIFKSANDFRTFKAGETIFSEGDPGEEMFVVRKGTVSLKINGQLIVTAEEDETFGEMALIDGRTRSATAEAVTDCEVVPIDSRRFLFLVHQTPNFALIMLRVLANRLRTMDAAVK
jgi:CRP/FNR family cyclic AMP-dependent transcriptional regulator